MKKKITVFIASLVCALIFAIGLAACGKELNYLKVKNDNGQLKTELDIGTYSVGDIAAVKSKLSGLEFYFEYFPDNSTEKADMSKVKVKYFINNEGTAGLPETLQSSCSYTVYYYYEGHEPTADFSDALAVRISFNVE